MIYKLVTRVIQYFCFPDRPMKGGDILDFWKGGNLRKGRVWPSLPTMDQNNLIGLKNNHFTTLAIKINLIGIFLLWLTGYNIV